MVDRAARRFVPARFRCLGWTSRRFRDAVSGYRIILNLDYRNVYGASKVDADGFQVAHKMVLFQWQDGKKALVWPETLAPTVARFPTPA